MENRQTVRDILTTTSIYKGVVALPYTSDEFIDGSSILADLLYQLEPKRVAEVGVGIGMTTRYLCNFPFIEEVVCVDTWDAKSVDNPNRTMFEQFLANCYHSEIWSKVYPLRMTSLAGVEECSALGLSFDMIWINADHLTTSVKNDIVMWMPLLAPGGLIGGGAWGWITEPYNVRKAVIESAAIVGMKVNSHGNMWWYTKQEKENV